MLDYREELLSAASRYESLTGKSRATAAGIVVKDSRFFDRIESKGGCTVDTYQKVMAWLKENTPSAPREKKTNGKHNGAS